MTEPTIQNATVTARLTEKGTRCFDITADDGFMLYRKSDLDENTQQGFPEATYFCRYICATENETFTDILTMTDSEAEKIMNTETEVL